MMGPTMEKLFVNHRGKRDTVSAARNVWIISPRVTNGGLMSGKLASRVNLRLEVNCDSAMP